MFWADAIRSVIRSILMLVTVRVVYALLSGTCYFCGYVMYASSHTVFFHRAQLNRGRLLKITTARNNVYICTNS